MHIHTQSNHRNTKGVFIWMSVFGVCGVCSVAQSCLTLCDPLGCSLPDSSVHGISRKEYWSGLPFPPPGYLPNPGTQPMSPASPALQADSLPLSHWGSPNQLIDSIQALSKSWQACCRNLQADSKICMKAKTILKKNIVRD